MWVLIIGFLLTICAGIIPLLKAWKRRGLIIKNNDIVNESSSGPTSSETERKRKFDNTLAILSFVFVVFGALLSLSSGLSTRHSKILSDSLSAQKEQENKTLTDSLLKLNGVVREMLIENKDSLRNVTTIQGELSEAQKAALRLSFKINELVKQANEKVDEEFAVTGTFSFFPLEKLQNADQFEVVFGKYETPDAYNWPEIKATNGNYKLMNLTNTNININLVNYKLIIDAKVYDINRNIIAEIKQNNWRINKNSTSKFNYDSSGFEVFDNKGRVALSLDIRKRGVYIRGILRDNNSDIAWYYTDEEKFPVLYSDDKSILRIDSLNNNKILITPLFSYTGNNWRHKRLK